MVIDRHYKFMHNQSVVHLEIMDDDGFVLKSLEYEDLVCSGQFNMNDMSVVVNGICYANYLEGIQAGAALIDLYVSRRNKRYQNTIETSKQFGLAIKDYLNTKSVIE